MSDFLIHVASIACIYGMLALALNLQAGFTGLVNFGLVALFGCGIYGAALAHALHWPLMGGVAAALGMAILLGAFLARLGKRLSSDYWGIATLSIAEVIRITVTNEKWTGGAQGISGLSLLFADLKPWDGLGRLGLFGAVLVLTYWLCQKIADSRFGLAMKLMREEPQLARALGHDVDGIRLRVMVISSIIAAASGVLYAHYLTFVGPDQLVSADTFLIWSMIIVGGIANNAGVVLGAVLMQFAMAFVPFVKDILGLPTDFVAAARLLLVGGGILIFLLVRPQGLLPERVGRRA
ncbi:MAG TPA: branched-chain amino acid ABC transporter permease [Bosea sp. (in: a-proteobacteria)]|uniref:branched-chain amino acid ABC transporter permease n=1 Tax=Bosea sp. (in: a-proteobacteria) TaxID=1871050 RepID=UPI002E158E24|nr:branched-chain amino acid ABC transporter permease [Bosea sp. (in: a-proteobacteria)]